MKVKELFEETYINTIIALGEVDNGIIIHDYSKDNTIDGFDCSNLKLTSLEHSPTKVGRFKCFFNRLTSLEHCPNIITDGNFLAYHNQISSLKGIGKEYCLEINGYLDLIRNPLTSSVLGLLLIKKLTFVTMNNEEVEKIMNKHLVDRDIVKCRQELIEAGFKEYAKL